MVIYDEQLVSPGRITSRKHISIPASGTAIKELDSREVANIVILGAVVEITRIIGKDSLISAIKEDVPARFKDLNLRAVEIGSRLAKEAG